MVKLSNSLKLARLMALQKRFKTGLLILLLAVSNAVWAQSITVESDRQTIEYGDIFTLKITADYQVITGQLDLSILDDQFEVLGSQRSNNIQMVNGDFQSSTTWLVQLSPKKEGDLIIPPFEFENVQSDPYLLTVTPNKIEHSGTALQPFFLESSVDVANPYIQQQVIYTLRFYHQGRYVDGMIRPPKFDKMMLEVLKDQTVYQKQIQGKNFTVYEWIYALYPQSSGKVVLDPPMFNGRIQYAGQLRSVKKFAKAIELDIQVEPASYSQQATNSWLPTKSLTLTDNWTQPTGNQIRIGDTLTQTVTMTVQGLKVSQLPNLTLQAQANYKVYPEKPQSSERPSVNGISSIKQFKRSIVPTQVGTLTLPEQVVYWWNTETNQLDKTTLPAKTFEVKNALVEQQNLVDCTLPSQGLTATPGGANSMQGVSSIWPWLTALFALLWLATGALFIRHKRQAEVVTINPQQTAEELAKIQTQQACSDIDSLCKLPPNALYPALKQWLKKQHQIQHFSELNNPELQALIQQLEASLYSEKPLDDRVIEQLAEALKTLENTKSTGLLKSKQADSKLATLYKR